MAVVDHPLRAFALRAHRRGRELLAVSSARFRIAGDPGFLPWAMRVRAGEVWMTGLEGVGDDGDAPPGAVPGTAAPRLAPRWPALALLAPPSARAALGRSAPLTARAPGRDATLPAPARPGRCRLPIPCPLRI
jgi:hypothetical protein